MASISRLLPKSAEKSGTTSRRLNKVAARFSKIGSRPDLKDEDLAEVIRGSSPTSRNAFHGRARGGPHHCDTGRVSCVHQQDLFEWVVENLMKNALDAMEDRRGGHVPPDAVRKEDDNRCHGYRKGSNPRFHKDVFRPGYSTKQGAGARPESFETHHRGISQRKALRQAEHSRRRNDVPDSPRLTRARRRRLVSRPFSPGPASLSPPHLERLTQLRLHEFCVLHGSSSSGADDHRVDDLFVPLLEGERTFCCVKEVEERRPRLFVGTGASASRRDDPRPQGRCSRPAPTPCRGGNRGSAGAPGLSASASQRRWEIPRGCSALSSWDTTDRY